jgi:hypothetical protein
MNEMKETVRFRLRGRDREAVEADLGLAMLAAESLYGQPRLRLEAGYRLAANGRVCVIETRGEAGAAVARIFAGLTSARVGEDGYSVERMDEGVRTAERGLKTAVA